LLKGMYNGHMSERDTLRKTFDSAAADYNAVRPGYPEQLYDDVMSLAGIQPNGCALEIGCGTGIATLPFAQRGLEILCLDIGPELIALARKNLSTYPLVRFEQASFEDWPVYAGAFDLVYAATAFHWIPPEIGYRKAAEALKAAGSLAIFDHEHPRPFPGFFEEVQPIYNQHVPEWSEKRKRTSLQDEIESKARKLRDSGFFAEVLVKTYSWSHTYTTSEYLRLLNTYSDHLLLEDARRCSLYQAIGDLIERNYQGHVDRPYLTVLYLARKLVRPH